MNEMENNEKVRELIASAIIGLLFVIMFIFF